MNLISIMTDMELQGWAFRSFQDEQQKHRYVGNYKNYGCLVDTKKDKLEFWCYDNDWWIDYKFDIFCQAELERLNLSCDYCDGVQDSGEKLQLVNVTHKACEKCLSDVLTK